MNILTQVLVSILTAGIAGAITVYGAGQYLRGIFETWRKETDRRMSVLEKESREAKPKDDCLLDMEELQRGINQHLADLKHTVSEGFTEVFMRLRELEIKVAEMKGSEKK